MPVVWGSQSITVQEITTTNINAMKRFFTRSFTRGVPKQKIPTLRASILPTPIAVTVTAIGASIAAYYLFDARAGIHEYVFCPLIRTFTDAENGHKLGIKLMSLGLAPKLREESPAKEKEFDTILGVDIFGTHMKSPIGLAAGLDKEGQAVDALFDTGFSYVEVGSITPEAQPGNPQPRFFRLPRDDAVINRYGFNSLGHLSVLNNLRQRLRLWEYFLNLSQREGKLLGVNLGKNKNGDEVQDYVLGVRRFAEVADVLVVNVSSPNTPGLRDLQSELKLTNLLKAVVKERNSQRENYSGRKPPVLVKVAPDLTEPEIESIANSAKDSKVDGIIISNTTIQRPNRLLTTDMKLVNETGGLSGKPLKPLSLQALRTLRKHTKDSNLVLVGCGGISSGKDALEFGKAGASFIELYTAFAYKGPGLPARIRDELTDLLKKEGKTWQQIVGEDDK